MSENASDTRAELFAALQALAKIVPEMRAGQFMSVLAALSPARQAVRLSVATAIQS